MLAAADLGWTIVEAAEGAAGPGAQAVAIGGTAASAALTGAGVYRIYKRMRMDTDEVVPPNASGGTQMCREANVRRGRKRTSAKRILKKLEMASDHLISRFQSLTSSPGIASSLSQVLSYYTEADKQYLPVYALNLSAIAFNSSNNSGTVQQWAGYPLYRLTKSSTNQYRWESQLGISCTAAGGNDSAWQREDWSPGYSTTVDVTKYTLDWVSARIMVRAADTVDTHVDFYEVSFKDWASPQRTAWNGSANVTEDPAPTGDDENQLKCWWDHYLAARTVHPFRSTYLPKGVTENAWKIYRHKTISMGPMNNAQTIYGTNDTLVPAGHTKCENFFMRYDKDIDLRSANPNSATATSDVIVGNTVPQTLGYPANTGTSQCTMFQPRDRERWLVISAKVITKFEKTDQNPVPVASFPTFDCVLRQKVIVDER